MSESIEVIADWPNPPGADDCICRTYWDEMRKYDGIRRFGVANQFIGYLLALKVCDVIDEQDYLTLRMRIMEISDAARREVGV